MKQEEPEGKTRDQSFSFFSPFMAFMLMVKNSPPQITKLFSPSLSRFTLKFIKKP